MVVLAKCKTYYTKGVEPELAECLTVLLGALVT